VRYDFKHPDGVIKGGYASLNEARGARVKVLAEARAGGWAEPSKLTLEEFAERWLERKMPRGSGFDRDRLAPSSYEGYALSLKRHVLPRLGRKSLVSLRPHDVDGLIHELEVAGYAPGTVRNVIVPLRKMLNDAKRGGLLRDNPALGADLPPAQDFRGQEIPEEHLALIREALAAGPVIWLYLFEVVLGTGVRLGELRALRWRHWDREAKILHIDEAYSRRHLKRPKTTAGRRMIPVFPSLESALTGLEAFVAPGRRGPDELIFPTQRGTPLHESNFRRRVWYPALRAAGLMLMEPDGRERAMYRIHDLRHTCASRLVQQGCDDIKLIQEITGHSNAAILLNRYSHLRQERVTAAASRFDPGIDRKPVDEAMGSTEVAR
jgi:integrase